MTDQDKRTPDRGVREHEDEKPGAPPRPATEPAGDRTASRTDKTRTDPATGEHKNGAPGSEKL